ncbi:EthD domain-containing protein [Nitrospirillum sp. BR 11163]|uniref:EthD domain-containing protein n=1 Tax=Nitrospirillum sp. BR 11163 TaxID=3104323 RepID=UPI002AFF8E1A|nr:EthD domain-containing protein [Nitrospirillum sp. BR 11163]MEA1673417.1 EthD domain-containing protein [Nitrospirillum sp. BR 11163]
MTDIKLLIAGRRCLTKSREQALAHLRTVHGPMVFSPPADAGAMPSRYEQNHVFHPSTESSGSWLADRDFVTEIWFNDFPHLAASISTPYYMTHLRPDEDNFVDQDTVLKSVVREEGKWGVTKPDAAKLFIFLKRSPSISIAVFNAARTGAMDDLRTQSQPLAGLVNVALPGPGGLNPTPIMFSSSGSRTERQPFPPLEAPYCRPWTAFPPRLMRSTASSFWRTPIPLNACGRPTGLTDGPMEGRQNI